jgi:hypothetical protein
MFIPMPFFVLATFDHMTHDFFALLLDECFPSLTTRKAKWVPHSMYIHDESQHANIYLMQVNLSMKRMM